MKSLSSKDMDISPPRRRRTRNDAPSPEPNRPPADLSPQDGGKSTAKDFLISLMFLLFVEVPVLKDQGDDQRTEGLPQSWLGKAYADIIQYTVAGKSPTLAETGFFNLNSLFTGVVDNSNARNSTTDTF